ncbi:MAG: DUF3822 family protein [Flavobacteriaceae bacterium]
MKLIPVETGQNYTTLQKINSSNTNQIDRLSVQVTLCGLSFLISSSETDKAFVIKQPFDVTKTPEELLEALEIAFKKEEKLKQAFTSVTVLFGSQYYTLVPSSLFEETKASEYLKFNTKILPNDFISFDEVETHDMKLVYIPFANVINYVFDKFGDFKYFHTTTVLLKHFLEKEKFTLGSLVILHVEQDWFDCFVFNNGALQLCNSYPYKTPEDFIYFVLFVFEQLNINPETSMVKLCGAISTESSLYKILYKYIRHISFVENTSFLIENEQPQENLALKLFS